MGKEIGMFNKIAFALIAVALTACQGNNAFKRESNPTKNYQSVLDKSQAYSPEAYKAQQDKEARQQQLPCGIPFLVTIDQGDKGDTAVFTEGVEKTVQIKVDRIAGQLAAGMPWDVKPFDLPCENCFEQVSATEDSRLYKFTWNVPKGSAGSDAIKTFELRFKWDIEARCSTTPVSKTIALVVNKSANDPVLSFKNTKDIKFHDVLAFQLTLEGATSKLGKLSFVDKAGISTADAKITECGDPKIDAKKVVTYDCTFNSGALKDADVKDLIGKDSVQQIALNARIDGKKPLEASVNVNVTFEKVEAAKTAEVAPAAATTETAPAKAPLKKTKVVAPKKGATK